MKRILFALLLLAAGYAAPAHAQVAGARFVSACGQANTTPYPVFSIDPNGYLCTSSGGGSGSTGTAAAPSSAVATQQGPALAMQRSAALETCHTFTKSASTSAIRTLSVKAQTATGLHLFLLDLAAAPTSGSNILSSLLQPYKVNSDGSTASYVVNYSGAPVSSTNGFTACLSTTAEPTYTAASAIGFFTAQVP